MAKSQEEFRQFLQKVLEMEVPEYYQGSDYQAAASMLFAVQDKVAAFLEEETDSD